ncbi:uncharacterized protein PHALS_14773 [Plasmopara halstedii]|uniref:Uncharacterized protein n=1 Tax=Plasmopara halstedii TaxID=4781 RepID=A0A0P1AR83_PLAHL|nr:uncharacterized protein PHALS_14773 [Plasmopara halstedii]CEG44093.1 hypothetical protein PHALS_14773 [Plasmopara halstedii]|eukprot:XP_024580462.1 hypothetical protein PHALS_14773 [Plasmopara halstedii]
MQESRLLRPFSIGSSSTFKFYVFCNCCCSHSVRSEKKSYMTLHSNEMKWATRLLLYLDAKRTCWVCCRRQYI